MPPIGYDVSTSCQMLNTSVVLVSLYCSTILLRPVSRLDLEFNVWRSASGSADKRLGLNLDNWQNQAEVWPVNPAANLAAIIVYLDSK